MIDLDDASAVRAADPGGMLDAVAGMLDDCAAGYEAGRGAADLPSADGVTAVTFCGMGGSAVSGDVLRALYRGRLAVPVEIVRAPELPAHCGPHTLVVCSSYSGDTAETLSCFEEAVARNCRIAAITSGGRLETRALETGRPLVLVSAGMVSPRAALGHLEFALFGALERIGLLPALDGEIAPALEELVPLAGRLRVETPVSENPAKELAARLGGRVPVVWGAEGIGSVAAARWKTQLNENAKVPAFASSLPELDHNEVVGWSDDVGHAFVVVALRHAGEHPDVVARFPLSLHIAQSSGVMAEEVWAAGSSPLSQFLSLVLVGDFVSVYLAISRGVDPTPVEAIDRLKRALAER